MATITRVLWAKPGALRFPYGVEVPFWGFSTTPMGNPRLPGPIISARVGDTINFIVRNNLNDFISLIFPGQEIVPMPVKDNGVFVSYNTHASPGETVRYSFTTTRPGVFRYESGTRPEIQVSMGLYGAIVVYPADFNTFNRKTAYGSDTDTDFDVEKVLIFSEIDSQMNTAISAGNPYNMLDFKPDNWLINGRSYPYTLLPNQVNFLGSQPLGAKINAAAGEKVLLRCINAGSQNHTFRLEGITARVIAVDSWPLTLNNNFTDTSYLKNTITIASGESYDLLFTANTNGQHFLYDRDLFHLCSSGEFPGGMATRLDVLPSQPPFFPIMPWGLTCSTLDQNRVRLSWTNLITNAEGFVVERRSGSGAFQTIAVLTASGLTEYIDASVLPDNNYTYRIRSYNAAGLSFYSNQCSISTDKCHLR